MGKSFKFKKVKLEKREIFEDNQNLCLLHSIRRVENAIAIAFAKLNIHE